MSYSEPLINQPRVLLLSVGVGALLCIFYIIIQGFFRILGEGRLSYYHADGVFCVIFALVSFFFMVLYNNGRVRLHLILGEGAGFFIFYFSVGKYLYDFTVSIANSARWITLLLLKPLVIMFSLLKEKYGVIKCVINKKIASFIKKENDGEEAPEKKKKKVNLFGKIHLKNPNKSV